MNTFPDLIKRVCKTEKTSSLVARAIPILVRWAVSGVTSNTYGDLNRELVGKSRFSGIGHVLGCIEEVLSALRMDSDNQIPTLNALVNNAKTGMPSGGLCLVCKEYESLSAEGKRAKIKELNDSAIKYEHWDTVLFALGLPHSVIASEQEEDEIRRVTYQGSCESHQHKSLKEFIFLHPESIGIRDVIEKEKEYVLLSGDKPDVFFRLKDHTSVAIEVKSIISPSSDILRGLYQCVKYEAVIAAEKRTHGSLGDVRSILVIEGKLSESNCQTKNMLGVKVIEGFKHK